VSEVNRIVREKRLDRCGSRWSPHPTELIPPPSGPGALTRGRQGEVLCKAITETLHQGLLLLREVEQIRIKPNRSPRTTYKPCVIPSAGHRPRPYPLPWRFEVSFRESLPLGKKAGLPFVATHPVESALDQRNCPNSRHKSLKIIAIARSLDRIARLSDALFPSSGHDTAGTARPTKLRGVSCRAGPARRL